MARRAHLLFLAASLGAHALVAFCMTVHCPSARPEETVADLVSEITLPVSVVAQVEPQGALAAPVASPEPSRVRAPRERVPEPAVTATQNAVSVPEEVTVAALAPTPLAPTESTGTTSPGERSSESQGAPAGPSGSAGEGTGAVRADDGSAVRAFVAGLRARVQAARRYPRTALERGLEGDVVVTLEITRDGTVRITSVSANGVPAVLVTAATDAVRDAGHFPFPSGIARDVVRARLPIRFHVSE